MRVADRGSGHHRHGPRIHLAVAGHKVFHQRNFIAWLAANQFLPTNFSSSITAEASARLLRLGVPARSAPGGLASVPTFVNANQINPDLYCRIGLSHLYRNCTALSLRTGPFPVPFWYVYRVVITLNTKGPPNASPEDLPLTPVLALRTSDSSPASPRKRGQKRKSNRLR